MSYNLLRFKTYKRETSYIKKKRKYRSRSKSSNRREKIIKEHYSYLSKGFFFFNASHILNVIFYSHSYKFVFGDNHIKK